VGSIFDEIALVAVAELWTSASEAWVKADSHHVCVATSLFLLLGALGMARRQKKATIK
jgi:hypothetical protein